jgi:hypothetical protein
MPIATSLPNAVAYELSASRRILVEPVTSVSPAISWTMLRLFIESYGNQYESYCGSRSEKPLFPGSVNCQYGSNLVARYHQTAMEKNIKHGGNYWIVRVPHIINRNGLILDALASTLSFSDNFWRNFLRFYPLKDRYLNDLAVRPIALKP